MTSPVAIITGAGSGIGRATALRLARAGWRLALVGRDHARLRETHAAIAKEHPAATETHLAPADLAKTGLPRTIVDGALLAFGRIDAIVNSAGMAQVVPIDKTSEELLQSTFAVNVFGPALLVAATWPTFAAQRSGVVVNISSMAAFDPFPGFFVYGATKAALDGMTRSAAIEGAAIGVTAYSINPGAVETKMLRSAFGTDIVPEERALHPDAVAEIVFECVAGMRKFDNGRAVPVVRR